MAHNRRTLSSGKKTKGPVVKSQGTGIKCPKCGGLTKVTNSSPDHAGNVHNRYRKCLSCGQAMKTTEEIVHLIDKHATRRKA